ncbi:golgin subfamily A member 2-like [Battus philenor]|uniref:golgin subfamily A member 2-like n=1 Tax=Battus philenor TaxID=42288 RepID=UPI0035CF206F
MDERAAKLAAARQKLKHHQEKNMARMDSLNSTQNSNATPTAQTEVANAEAINHNRGLFNALESNVSKNYADFNKNDLNVTEILITNKTQLEEQVKTLETQLNLVQSNYNSTLEQQNVYAQNVHRLEMELQTIKNSYVTVNNENSSQKILISELQDKNIQLTDKNNNLLERLEFTETLLTVKENENSQLSNHISVLQNQLDVFQLQIQQLTNTSSLVCHDQENKANVDLQQKISSLEQQVQALQKENENINSHYEQYVNGLNAELKTMEKKNNELIQETNRLYNRENSLVDQISDMELRLQNYQSKRENEDKGYITQLQETLKINEEKIQELKAANDNLLSKYKESIAQVEALSKNQVNGCEHDSISISKLHADIASDKVAAQRATEQNRKLKSDLEELEYAFVKMSRDKLDLTEKLTHEKHLNQELMLKLADVEENMKLQQNKLLAKDEEMIRLQNSYRTLEGDYEKSKREIFMEKEKVETGYFEKQDLNLNLKETLLDHSTECKRKQSVENNNEEKRLSIAKDDAMLKLQERFLNIMDEVANLSDEKHRLEHIIFQLQNETDTICEYIALYQQQRSLLKRRDEERSVQIKMFQTESEKLKRQIEELNNLLLTFSNDKELHKYLQDESRKNDLDKVMNLLFNLKNSFLVCINDKSIHHKSFYPCNCCSGQLIDV